MAQMEVNINLGQMLCQVVCFAALAWLASLGEGISPDSKPPDHDVLTC
jgi:hypothetical protein